MHFVHVNSCLDAFRTAQSAIDRRKHVPAASVAYINHHPTAAIENSDTETMARNEELSGANSGRVLDADIAKRMEGKLIEFRDDIRNVTNTALVETYNEKLQTHRIVVYSSEGDLSQEVYLTPSNCKKLKSESNQVMSPREVRARRRERARH